jgi:hypothetical protein
MTSELAVTALRNAIALRDPAATAIVHSDRGSQFRSHAYQRVLRDAQLRGSIGRVGTCADNAAMVVLQPVAEEHAQPPPLAQPRRAPPCDRHLDRDHLPPPRRQDALGCLTPIEFETLTEAAHAA